MGSRCQGGAVASLLVQARRQAGRGGGGAPHTTGAAWERQSPARGNPQQRKPASPSLPAVLARPPPPERAVHGERCAETPPPTAQRTAKQRWAHAVHAVGPAALAPVQQPPPAVRTRGSVASAGGEWDQAEQEGLAIEAGYEWQRLHTCAGLLPDRLQSGGGTQCQDCRTTNSRIAAKHQ